MATSVPVPMAIPTSAAANAGASFIRPPHRNHSPYFLNFLLPVLYPAA